MLFNGCLLLIFVLFLRLIGASLTSKLLGNVSMSGCGSFTSERVMGEKQNSMLFTCCLHKESLAGDKNRFQTLSTPVCVCARVCLMHTRSHADMRTRTPTDFTAGTHTVTTREHFQQKNLYLKLRDNGRVRVTMSIWPNTSSLTAHCCQLKWLENKKLLELKEHRRKIYLFMLLQSVSEMSECNDKSL